MRMIRGAMALAALAVLAGCAMPLEQCLNAAGETTREIEHELSVRRRNVDLGYSIEYVARPRLVMSICEGPGGAPTPCPMWDDDVVVVHHRIDPALERERIALLERQLERERPRAEAAAAECRAAYPAR